MSDRRFLEHIEILRGISVLFVLCFHLTIPAFGAAYLGVDVFFVISGFLMALLYGGMATKADVIDFYCRRLARLLPAYFVVLIIGTIVAASIALPHEIADTARHSYWSAALAPNIGFWLDASYFDDSYFRPLLNFWSLGVELQFYLIFPLVAMIDRRARGLAVLLSLASLALYLLASGISPKTAFFHMPLRVWQFMAGFYAAKLAIEHSGRLGASALALLLAWIVGAAYLAIPAPILSVVTVALAAIFLMTGLPERALPTWLKGPLLVAGTYSYSIYLVHFPIIVFLAYRPFGGTSLALDGASQYAVALVATAVAAFALHHLVERPLRGRRAGAFILKSMVAGGAVATLTAAAIVPASQVLVPKPQYLASAAWFDRLDYRCPKVGRILHPSDESCLITGGGGPSFLLVGDSHADLLKKQLGEAVAEYGGTLRLMVQNYAVGAGYSPDVILREAQLRDATIILHSAAEHVRPDAIAALAKSGAKVAFIAPVPRPGFHVPEYIFSQIAAGLPVESSHGKSTYLENHRAILSGVRSAAQSYPNLRVLYPAETLCTPDCQIVAPDGRPLYSDNGHLTQTGVGWIRPHLREAVRP